MSWTRNVENRLESPTTILWVYGGLVVLASLAGGWLLLAAHLTHARLQVAVSFVAGLMLAMALLHFIPHAFFQVESVDRVARWALGGFLVMFFLQRFFNYHHHDVEEAPTGAGCGHAHHAGEPHGHGEGAKAPGGSPVAWVGTLIGLGLHSLLDGIALGAAVAADTHGEGLIFGLGAFLAIVLHKPFDAMAISTLMTSGGSSRTARHVLNGVFALSTPLGMLLFYLGASQLGESQGAAIGCALAFSAGTFLCIAASDLLPELQFHSHDRVKLSLALAAGIGVAILIGKFETSGHDHFHDGHDHDHDHGRIAAPGAARAVAMTPVLRGGWPPPPIPG